MTECESPLGGAGKTGGACGRRDRLYHTHSPRFSQPRRKKGGGDMRQKRETIFVKKNKNRS